MRPIQLLKISIYILIFLITGPSAWAGYYEEGCKFFTYKKYDHAREMFLKDIEATDRGNSYYYLGEIEKNEINFEKAAE